MSPEEKKHQPEEPVLEANPAPRVVSGAELPVHGGGQRNDTGLQPGGHGPEEPKEIR